MTNSKELHVKLVPNKQKGDPLPEQVQWFFANKLYHTISEGGVFWKAGEYSWVGGVNSEIGFENEDKFQDVIAKGRMLDYTIARTFIKSRLCLAHDRLIDNKTGVEMSRDTILQGEIRTEHNSDFDKNIYELFATNFICDAYLADELNGQQAIDLLKQLSEEAMLESQKLLYVGLQAKPELDIKRKENIYSLLEVFSNNGFPKVLDVFNSRVDNYEDGVAVVKLYSRGPEGSVRLERFEAESIVNNHLEKNARFDFAVYIPASTLETQNQVQPI